MNIAGTGKTATILRSIKSLQEKSSSGELPEFEFVEINCLRLQTPSDACKWIHSSLVRSCHCHSIAVQIISYNAPTVGVLWRALSGEHLSNKSAKERLTAHFASTTRASKSSGSGGGGGGITTVCMVDEMDFLLTKDENVIYSFFDWPIMDHSGLVVVGVSNVSDLPERLSTRCVFTYSYWSKWSAL